MGFPGDGYEVKHPGDVSVMTYRGHQVGAHQEQEA